MGLTPIHPGEHLKEELEALDMSAAELARKLSVPTNRITHILNGRRGISEDLDVTPFPRPSCRDSRRSKATDSSWSLRLVLAWGQVFFAMANSTSSPTILPTPCYSTLRSPARAAVVTLESGTLDT